METREDDLGARLRSVLARAPRGREWIEGLLAGALDRSKLLAGFAAATRRMGRDPVVDEDPRLAGYCTDDAARVALLLSALRALPDAEHLELVEDLFYRGETREKQAVLRALPHLPDPARYVALAVDACRTNSKDEFEAIACENPFARDAFGEHDFNHLVLKAIFMGTRVARIAGLSARANPRLAKMVEDYASERRAAGRAVPDDVAFVLDRCAEATKE